MWQDNDNDFMIMTCFGFGYDSFFKLFICFVFVVEDGNISVGKCVGRVNK